jgi:hypothetical protein
VQVSGTLVVDVVPDHRWDGVAIVTIAVSSLVRPADVDVDEGSEPYNVNGLLGTPLVTHLTGNPRWAP